MGRVATDVASPKQGIWRRFLLLIPLIAVLSVGSCAYIRREGSSYTSGGHVAYSQEEFAAREAITSDPSVLEVLSVEQSERGGVFVTVHALADGESMVTFAPKGQPDAADAEQWHYRVYQGVVFDQRGNFEGWEALDACLLVLLVALVALFASCFVRLWRASWYGYTMVVSVACALFCLFQLLLFGLVTMRVGDIDVTSFLGFVGWMVPMFAICSAAPMFVICLLVSLSNISLIIHEGRRPVNMLGIAASVAFGVAYIYTLLGDYNNDFDVSRSIRFLLMMAIVFGVCLLLAVMACAGIAAHHRPRRLLDYIVILGCGIRADGTPCPLLAGRVDRAVAYARELEATEGKQAVFVPSGGQGPDEPVSEAQSMRDYLVSVHGIDPGRIVCEDRSTTTRENMAFSRKVIERHAGRDAGEIAVGFSTTNYHVFRGYVCAHQAGMDVEGMGSRTKYYFWPNAFLREFVGLLVAKWRVFLLLFGLSCAIALVIERLSGSWF